MVSCTPSPPSSISLNSVWSSDGEPVAALHIQAAIDGIDVPGDVAGIRVGQKLDDPRNLIGFGETTHRNLRQNALQSLLGSTGRHVGFHEARGNRVDRDALAGGL